MPRQTSDDKKQGQVVQCRLHPKYEAEAEALEILEYWKEQGYQTRYIITAALNALEGYDLPPVEASGGVDGLNLHRVRKSIVQDIETMLSDKLQSVSYQNNIVDPSALEQSNVEQPYYDDDEDDTEPVSVNAETFHFASQFASLMQPGLYDDDEDEDD